MENDIFSGLSKFGLSPYEIRIYEVLVLKGPMSSTEVVKLTGIPQPRVYDLFNSLIKKGFIEESMGKKKIYKAIPVSQVLKREKDWLDSYSLNLQRYVENKKMYPDRYSTFLSLVEGYDGIIQKMQSMINEAENEIIISLSSHKFYDLKEYLQRASSRGVTVAVLVFTDEDVQFEGQAIVRTIHGKPTEMVISDRRSCIISVEAEKGNSEYALYFEEDNFIHVMSYYFNQSLWSVSRIVKNFYIAREIKFCNIWLTCDAIDFMFSRGIKLDAEVEGFYHDDRRTIKGEIIKTERIPFVRNTFYIKSGDKTYSVGGKTATLEDIKMINVKLHPSILQQ
ncbi:TrmB family transcriptional regulator [Thermoplasma sp. Kam2015]|uniref:TrmB family transcriptional regulator n=2 Tax=unclassified Thermoplasma TaxID=2684908 RepID=UPI00137B1AD9|nr:TrmB family transcriptional regulator [Thermoplasma sp. Kam2015]